MRILTELLEVWSQSELSTVLADELAHLLPQVGQLQLLSEYQIIHSCVLVNCLHQCRLQTTPHILNLSWKLFCHP